MYWLGSRPGGMIASAWAAMISMGQDGYLALAKEVKNTTNKILEAVESMDGIKVITQPDMTGLALVSDSSKINIIAVADAMEKRGWVMERQQKPDSIHVGFYGIV